MNTILEFGDEAGSETKALIENVVEEACGDLEKLVASWFFMPGHSLKFGPAEDDDGTPNPEIFCVEFIRDRKTLCYSFFDKSDFEGSCDNVRTISEYICGFGEFGQIELDDDAFDKWEESLGFTFSEAFMEKLGPQKALIPYIYAHVFADGGYINLEKAHESDYGRWEDLTKDLAQENLTLSEIIAASAGYSCPECINGLRPGWGSFAFFRSSDSQAMLT